MTPKRVSFRYLVCAYVFLWMASRVVVEVNAGRDWWAVAFAALSGAATVLMIQWIVEERKGQR